MTRDTVVSRPRRLRKLYLRTFSVTVFVLASLVPYVKGQGNLGDWSIFLPIGPGKDPAVKSCFYCHDLARVVKLRGDKDFWGDLIATMAAQGAQFTNDEIESMTNYFSTHLGPDQEPLVIPINVNTAKLEALRLLSPIAEHAQDIITAREQGKTFETIDDLLAVNGITKEQLGKVKPFVSVK